MSAMLQATPEFEQALAASRELDRRPCDFRVPEAALYLGD